MILKNLNSSNFLDVIIENIKQWYMLKLLGVKCDICDLL